MVRAVRNLRACWLVACAGLLVGCATTYAPPEAGAPSATLTLLRDPPPDAKDEVLTLSWDTDLDTRVFDQMKK